ncbi:hypothetical protein EVAR_96110_1 [Eumeta japonica]|uniref:Uncharacterized protein n=1 Tax=Eumeta variegata TaxID=151549 RepID=A0A4C1VE35_EUMVA|nr:hypothetical protein EVAR_96110_1 [Eumeta japonica]
MDTSNSEGVTNGGPGVGRHEKFHSETPKGTSLTHFSLLDFFHLRASRLLSGKRACEPPESGRHHRRTWTLASAEESYATPSTHQSSSVIPKVNKVSVLSHGREESDEQLMNLT